MNKKYADVEINFKNGDKRIYNNISEFAIYSKDGLVISDSFYDYEYKIISQVELAEAKPCMRDGDHLTIWLEYVQPEFPNFSR